MKRRSNGKERYLNSTAMTEPNSSAVPTWKLYRDNCILSRYQLVEHSEDSTYLSFLVLLNNSIELQDSLFQWFDTTLPSNYIILELDTPNLTVPTEYLPSPIRRYKRVLPYHPVTNLPEEPFAGNISLPVHLIPSYRDKLFPDHIFTISSTRLQVALRQKICQQTTIQLQHRRTSPIHNEEMPYFHVVGSLGLYKKSIDQEVLLLEGIDAPSDHIFKYVKLRVHPTHVGRDVNFILNRNTDWQKRMHRKLEKWDLQDKNGDYGEKMALVEVLYAKYVLSLRSQSQDEQF
jgi:hypothetical protein